MATTTNQTANKRLDVVETDLKQLAAIQGDQGRQLAIVAVEVNSISRTQHETAGKLDQLLARGAGNEATKGMVPSANLMWGIGALFAIVSIGITALTIFNNSIKEDITHAKEKRTMADVSIVEKCENLQTDFNKDIKTIEDGHALFVSREFDPISAKVQKMLTDRFTTYNYDRFMTDDFRPVVADIADLRESRAMIVADAENWKTFSTKLETMIHDLDDKINKVESDITSEFVRKNELE